MVCTRGKRTCISIIVLLVLLRAEKSTNEYNLEEETLEGMTKNAANTWGHQEVKLR